jgi:hypothetical protein
MGFGATMAPSTGRDAQPPAGGDAVGFDATLAPSTGRGAVVAAVVGGTQGYGAPVAAPSPVAAPLPSPAALAAPQSAVPVAALPAPAPGAAGSKSRGVMVAGALVLIASAVGIGWWMRPGTPVAPPPMVAESQPPQAVAPPAPPSPVSEAQPALAQPTPSLTAAPTPTETATTAPAAVAAQVKSTVSQPVRQNKPEEMPEDVRQDLEEGESALEQGDPKEALRLALKSQRTKQTAAAHSLLARAYCRMKDLTNAQPAFQKVAASEKARVKQYCIQNELDFF